MLRILRECKSNNQKALLWPIFQRLLRHALQRSTTTYAQVLWQMIGLIKLHEPAKFRNIQFVLSF